MSSLLDQYKALRKQISPLEAKGFAKACQHTLNIVEPKGLMNCLLTKQLEAVVDLATKEGVL